MNKTKFINKVSNDIMKEKFWEGYSPKMILKYAKKTVPQNKIEKRILQRIACVVGGWIKMKKEKFKNDNLVNLLSRLKSK